MCLTIHSSRNHFVVRLNSGVRPHKAVQRFGGFGVVVAPLLRRVFGSRRWLGDRASGSFHVAASGLRFGVRVPTLQGRDCSLLVGSSGHRSGSRGAASASRRAQLSSATVAA